MSSALYGPQHLAWQDTFGTRALAERVHDFIVSPTLAPEHAGFIASRDLFFLTTIDHRGYPTVSHKGGPAGFVRVLDPTELAFPLYDGNGMYLSLGNLVSHAKIGMLFIDFETPHRVRLHGEAQVLPDDPLLAEYEGAERVVRVKVTEVFVNCPRYIHRYQRVATSRYTPCPGVAPTPPQWKRIDGLQDVLPSRDADVAIRTGGVITPEEYGALVMKGEG